VACITEQRLQQLPRLRVPEAHRTIPKQKLFISTTQAISLSQYCINGFSEVQSQNSYWMDHPIRFDEALSHKRACSRKVSASSAGLPGTGTLPPASSGPPDSKQQDLRDHTLGDDAKTATVLPEVFSSVDVKQKKLIR
jgi:hypothetical protein